MAFLMTRINADTGAVLEQELPKLKDCRRYASYGLYDNGAADKRTAQTVAMRLAPGAPLTHGPYTFTVEKV